MRRGYLLLILNVARQDHSINIAQRVAKPSTAMHVHRPLLAALPMTPSPPPASFGPI